MALIANWPIGMAPGMGLNAFFAFTVVKTMGYTWEQALGAVFISGVIFLFLTFSGIRVWLIKGIPHSLRSAIAAGIGLFLAIIALSSAGIVAAHPATKVTLGNLTSPGPLFAILGFFIIASLDAARARRHPDRHPGRDAAVHGAGLQRIQGRVLGAAEPAPRCSSWTSWARCIRASCT